MIGIGPLNCKRLSASHKLQQKSFDDPCLKRDGEPTRVHVMFVDREGRFQNGLNFFPVN